MFRPKHKPLMPSRRLTAFILCSFIGITVFLLLILKTPFNTSLKAEKSNSQPSVRATFSDLELIRQYLDLELTRKYGAGDLYTVTCKIRIFKRLWENRAELDEQTMETYRKLQDHLYSWALKKHKSLQELYGSYGGKGIVMSLGSKYVKLAVHAIKAFRKLGCQLPFQIFYNGQEDLDQKSIDYLKTLKDVIVSDINDYFDVIQLNIHGWDLKPFAMLASSFAEVLLIDADAVFVQNPLVLFEDPGYLETGTLFFHDRTMGGYTNENITFWMDTFLPQPLSEKLRSSRLYTRVTNYEQESGVVLINKKERFMGMLATCRMNCPEEKNVLHRYTHGDKESFYLGMEMAQEPYYFVPVLSGSIGKLRWSKEKKEYRICGKLAHFDRHQRLLWFNDGIVADKGAEKSDPSDYEYFGIEGKWDGLCLIGTFVSISGKIKANLLQVISEYERDPLGMDHNPQAGAAMYNLGVVQQ